MQKQRSRHASKEEMIVRGDTTADPIGATFEEVYDNSFHYVIWNDQFYDDPEINGCSKSCSGPWGHSKGMVAWNDSGEGFVLQVTTPSWPAAGSKQFPRKTDGNTLGCVKDNDVQVSQDFFALKLTERRSCEGSLGPPECQCSDRSQESSSGQQRRSDRHSEPGCSTRGQIEQ